MDWDEDASVNEERSALRTWGNRARFMTILRAMVMIMITRSCSVQCHSIGESMQTDQLQDVIDVLRPIDPRRVVGQHAGKQLSITISLNMSDAVFM
jgi:hypothetical protein